VRPTRKKTSRAGGSKLLVGAGVVLAVAAASVLFMRRGRHATLPAPPPPIGSNPVNSDEQAFSAYGRSTSCKSCHEEAYRNWERSHHALAERNVDAMLDKPAFDPPWLITHGSQHSQARRVNGKPQLATQGPDASHQPFEVARVIGVSPLLQFLIPAEGGRFQASELCFDPQHPGWFNVYGEEDRRPGEWGHWTGRGMNWNNMCAACHNTRLRKNYDARTDAYATRMAEMGVACEACHGPMADHNAWQAKHPNQNGDPTVRKITRQEMFSVCAQCHARRSELTGDFRPGENFFDHHQLSIPDETEFFFADGQVREEDYEVTAFLGSKMHAAGVRCVDCHEPHGAKLRVSGNLMCLTCHSGPMPETNIVLNTLPVGPRIDPDRHSHHTPGTRGSICTDCHMPQTVYMQRHARHDHGFTVPDPRLTQELGIPNACNRCHTERSAAWALDAIVKWHGPRTNEVIRSRATAVTKARAGDAGAIPALVRMTQSESNGFWRAVAANLLKRWSDHPEVMAALLARAEDTNELVRAMAVRGLEPVAQAGDARVTSALAVRLLDPVRAVRVEAAWALRHTVNTNSTAGRDLLMSMRHNSDQPAGAMQAGVFEMDRGNLARALEQFRRAVKWDTNSAPLHHALAVALGADGKAAEAVDALQTACRLAPREAEYRFKLGLALNEAGRLADACAALEEAVKLDPQLSRAWYNLGLAYSTQGKNERATEALLRAESLDSNAPEIPYARATILAKLGRTEEARRAAQRALELNASFQEAKLLLQSLGQ